LHPVKKGPGGKKPTPTKHEKNEYNSKRAQERRKRKKNTRASLDPVATSSHLVKIGEKKVCMTWYRTWNHLIHVRKQNIPLKIELKERN
jgi:hypothetical protein